MLRRPKRSDSASPTSTEATNGSNGSNDSGVPARYYFLRRREGFWNNPMTAVAILAGSFAFAASLTLGVMNASADGGAAVNPGVWSRMLLGRSNVQDETGRLLLNSNNNNQETPLLIMGLPRSGSESFHDFFTCNQVKSSHYCCDTEGSSPDGQIVRTQFPCRQDQEPCGTCVLKNMKTQRAPFEGCGDYYVWSQFDVETTEPYSWFLPQHKALPLLHEAYPNAALILNTRQDAGLWADSVLHWYSITARMFNTFDLKMIENMDVYSKVRNVKGKKKKNVSYKSLMKDAQISLDLASDEKEHERKRNLLINVYEGHLKKVRNWAKEYNHQLMEINVDDPTAGNELARAFKMSASCWQFDAEKLDNDWKNFTFPF